MTISDINIEIRTLCDTDSTTLTDATLLRRVNVAYEQVIAWITGADGTWNFDDENYSTLPEGTTNLVEGQSDYSFSAAFLEIEWVKILDSNGHWHLIPPIDQSLSAQALEEYLITNGMPIGYDKVGNSIRLYPAPTASVVTLTAGMKIAINRIASLFTSAEVTIGTKTPGFASPFHVILAYMAAIPYCAAYKKDRVGWLNSKVGDTTNPPSGLKKDIITFYGHRERDRRKKLSGAGISFR